MIETEDIKKAILENKPLFTDGMEMSADAYDFLTKQSNEHIDMLFSEFPVSSAKQRTYIHVLYPCRLCNCMNTIKLTKSQFKTFKSGGFSSLMNKYMSISYREEQEIVRNLKLFHINDEIEDLTGICNDCINSFWKKINNKYNEFYYNPLEWVNTHPADVHTWQWDKVMKLYVYPPGFENIPEGHKYCGVKYKERDGKSLSEIFNINYYNWKTIRKNTIVERNTGSVREMLNTLLGDVRYADTTPATQKKAINIAESLLEGLVNGADLAALLKHVNKESNRILECIKRNSHPSRVIAFGKYKGLTIHEVIEIDPEYIHWAMNVVEGFKLTDDEKAHYKGEEWETVTKDNTEVESDIENVETEEDGNEAVQDVEDMPDGPGTSGDAEEKEDIWNNLPF